jgi:hypothetical protein
MPTRKVRTGRKTKRMLTRTKSRRYKVRGGDKGTELSREIISLVNIINDYEDNKIKLTDDKIAQIRKDLRVKMSMLKTIDKLGTEEHLFY